MAEYIDREAALFAVAGVKSHIKGNDDWNTGYRDALQAIGEMLQAFPSADVAEVVHGKWVFDFELDGYNFYTCSVCGRQENLLAKESTAEYFPYCHCGAKMGRKDEE